MIEAMKMEQRHQGFSRGSREVTETQGGGDQLLPEGSALAEIEYGGDGRSLCGHALVRPKSTQRNEKKVSVPPAYRASDRKL